MGRKAKVALLLLSILLAAIPLYNYLTPPCRSLTCSTNNLKATLHWQQSLPALRYELVSSPSGEAVLLVGARSPEGQVKLYVRGNLVNPEPYSFAISFPFCCAPASAAVSDDGSIFAIAANDLYVFMSGSPQPVIHFILPRDSNNRNYFTSVAMSRDGRHIGAISDSGLLYLFSPTNGGPLWTASITPGSWPAVAMSPDGTYLAASSASRVLLFSTDKPVPIHEWDVGRGLYYAQLVLAPDGSWAAVTSVSDDVVTLQHLSRTQSTPDRNVDLGKAYLNYLAVDPSGGNIVAANPNDGRIFVLAADGSIRDSWSVGAPLTQASLLGAGEFLAFGKGNGTVVLAYRQGKVSGWLDSGKPVLATAGTLDHLFALTLDDSTTGGQTVRCLAAD